MGYPLHLGEMESFQASRVERVMITRSYANWKKEVHSLHPDMDIYYFHIATNVIISVMYTGGLGYGHTTILKGEVNDGNTDRAMLMCWVQWKQLMHTHRHRYKRCNNASESASSVL
jgi:hypothetical protein